MAFDAFLKIDGIEGDSSDKSHPGAIVVRSFSWGLTNTGSSGGGGGGGAGKAVAQDFHFAMATSKASPELMLACATGKHIRDATLTCRKAGGDSLEFLKIKLTDVLVSRYDLAGAGESEDTTMDSLMLNFVKIDFLFTVPRTGETVEAAFNFATNTGG